jgi:hypothetical protein
LHRTSPAKRSIGIWAAPVRGVDRPGRAGPGVVEPHSGAFAIR